MAFLKHPRCPYCHDAVQPDQPKTACDDCMAWHHAECWDSTAGCGACKSTADVTQSRRRRRKTPPPSYALRPDDTPPPGYALGDLAPGPDAPAP